MSSSKVSVIIPVYNKEQYLNRCVESVNAQTHKNIEMVMVDDGSTDNSGRIVDKIAASCPNTIAIHQENQGSSVARRSGVLKSTGDYIMFLDSDDTLPADAVEYMVTMCEKENLDAFYGGYNRVINGKVSAHDNREFEGVVTSDKMLQNLLDLKFFYIAGMCFSRRHFWDAEMFCKERELPSEDVITNMKLALKCNRIGIYNKPVYNYYLVSTSLSITGKYFKQIYFKNFYNQLKQLLKENGKEELTKDLVHIKEIYDLGFLMNDIDTKDEWYKQIMAYDVSNYPRKIKVLHKLLHWPWLLHFCVKSNRFFKKL